MPSFGAKSQKNLAQCHPQLQMVFNRVIEDVDCAVICGHRTEEEQTSAYESEKSKAPWPKSMHNHSLSLAADVVPYPIEWKNLKRFYFFAGRVLATAESMGVKLRYGGDWDMDSDLDDQTFNDLPHFELVLEDYKR